MEISVKVNEEGGYKSAMLGLSLNKDKKPEDMSGVAKKLAGHDGGHNKFLEHIELWLIVRAPRYWWQEADTYRLSSKQSQSTMHTILDNKLENNNFENGDIFPSILRELNFFIDNNLFSKLKKHLPEGFMQTREWKMSYKTLRNIILQRRNHRLPHWKKFISEVLNQVEHPELLPELIVKH